MFKVEQRNESFRRNPEFYLSLALIKKGLVPNLSEFLDPPTLETQPLVVLLDVISIDDVRIRLMGTGLVQLTGRELTKTNALDIYAPESRKKVGQACVTMVKRPCDQMTERLVKTTSGLVVPASTVTLPVLCKSGQGCLAAFTQSRESIAAGNSMSVVREIISSEWIDIGAGFPSTA